MTTPNASTTTSRPAFKTTAQIYAELDGLMSTQKRFALFEDGTPIHKLKPGKNYFKLIAIPDAPLPFIPAKTFFDASWGTAFITPTQAKRIEIMRIKAAKAGTLKCGKNPNGSVDINYKQKMIFMALEIIPSTGRGTGPTVSAPKLLVLPSSNLKPQVGDVIAEFANEKDVNGNFKYRTIFNLDGAETPIVCIEVVGEGRNTQYTAKVDGFFNAPQVSVDLIDTQESMIYVDNEHLFGDSPAVVEDTAPIAPDDVPF